MKEYIREIKFKFWDTMLGEFTRYYSAPPSGIFQFNQSRYIALQYTGLKDKKGNEIYEGNILLLSGTTRRIVSYKNGMFIARKFNSTSRNAIKGVDRKYHPRNWGNQSEVIGNVFENTALMEV